MSNESLKHLDVKEIQLPDTAFIRDIDSRVIESICHQCLLKTAGVAPLEANILDNLLGRDATEVVKGIHVVQDEKKQSVHIKVDVNIVYGFSIPEKAEEIQMKIVEEVGAFTGLHPSSVHVIFKNLIMPKEALVQEEVLANV